MIAIGGQVAAVQTEGDGPDILRQDSETRPGVPKFLLEETPFEAAEVYLSRFRPEPIQQFADDRIIGSSQSFVCLANRPDVVVDASPAHGVTEPYCLPAPKSSRQSQCNQKEQAGRYGRRPAPDASSRAGQCLGDEPRWLRQPGRSEDRRRAWQRSRTGRLASARHFVQITSRSAGSHGGDGAARRAPGVRPGTAHPARFVPETRPYRSAIRKGYAQAVDIDGRSHFRPVTLRPLLGHIRWRAERNARPGLPLLHSWNRARPKSVILGI